MGTQRVITAGHQIITFFMFSVLVIGFLLLTNINLDTEFRGSLIFFLLLIGSFTAIFIVSFTDIFSKKLGGEKEAQLFFIQDISLIKFAVYVPIGLFASLGVALLVQNFGLDQQSTALLSIGGSGIIMMIIFFLSKTIMTSVLIHGFFNILVLALRQGILGDFTGLDFIPIPELGLTVGQFNTFGATILEQLSLVAFGEEMMKMIIIAFIVFSIPKAKFKTGISKYIGAVVAIIVWTAYHTIQAVV